MAAIPNITIVKPRRSRPRRTPPLPFMAIDPRGGFDYWAVETTGDAYLDADRGRAIGRMLVNFMRREPTNGNLTLLGCIVRDMSRKGDRAPFIQLGFLGEIARQALIGNPRHVADNDG